MSAGSLRVGFFFEWPVKHFHQILQQREDRWVIVNLRGKGNCLRTIPMPLNVKLAIDACGKMTRCGATD